jgi:hypothetical protein
MKKLFSIVVLVLSLPVMASMVSGGFVAVAGHVNIGGQPTGQPCSPCGCKTFPECVCDPGEMAGPCPSSLIGATPAKSLPESQSTGGAGYLLALFGAGLLVRFRMTRV